MFYVKINEVRKMGAKDCPTYSEKPEYGYFKCIELENENCGRGLAMVKYKDKVLVSHMIYPPRGGEWIWSSHHGITIGDIQDALEAYDKMTEN